MYLSTMALTILVGASGPESVSKPLIGVDFEHPGTISTPLNWNTMTSPGLMQNLVDETGALTVISISVSAGTPVELGVNPSQVPAYSSPLDEVDDYFAGSGSVTIQFSGLRPVALNEIYVFGLSQAGINQFVSAGSQSPTAAFFQVGAGNSLFVNSSIGSSSQQLSAFEAVVGSDQSGFVNASISASGALGWACAAVAIREVPGQNCYPDCDNFGGLDFFDFLCFQRAYNGGCGGSGSCYPDCDGSGGLDLFDFLCFQNAFVAGCP